MGRIARTPDNLFTMPKGSYVRNKSYVYVNVSNRYVAPNEKKNDKKGTRGYTDHDSVCIGVLADPSSKTGRMFYANSRYLNDFVESELPEPPTHADSMAIGLMSWIAVASDGSGLTEDLADVFGEEDAQMILDLADYMLSSESAVMQHYPAWGREHVLFSADIANDTEIGKFFRKNLTIPRISLFREKWAARNIGNGRLYLCYDSTNVNSQADGVFIVQKGHAKDDPSLKQVNTDYVIRQEDGLPFTYLHSPGSVTDIAQAQEMIAFIQKVRKLTGADVMLCLICDRGYISEKNLRHMDGVGIGYILMLRTTFSLHEKLADDVIDEIKTYKNELDSGDDEAYGITRECRLYKDGPTCYAQIIWSDSRYQSKRKEIKKQIADERRLVEKLVAAGSDISYTAEELKWIPECFRLKLIPGEPCIEERKKRGRGTGTKKVEIPTFRVTGYEDDEAAINRRYQKAGIIVIITSEHLTAQETVEAYSKRDCVEKTFEALKSHLGMDKIGVSTEAAMHGKGFIWFVASILHALMFNGTSKLRASDRKNYTVPAMVDQLEAIKADRDLTKDRRKRRYKLTRRQQNILSCFGVSEADIDERIASIRD